MKHSDSRFPNWLVSIAALALSIAFVAITLELITRAVLDDGMNFDLEMWKYARELKQVSPVESIGHEHVPGGSGIFMGVPVSINSLGMRDREMAEQKPENTIRILMLGDSLTFGWGVEVDHTPSKLLESMLNAETPEPFFEVLNTGVGNTNSSMQVSAFFERWRHLDPDVVILNYFINDAEPTPRRRERGVFENSAAVIYTTGAIDRLARIHLGKADWKEYYSSLYADGQEAWRLNKTAIAGLSEYCGERGIPLILVNYPELHQLKPYAFPTVTEAVAGLAESLGMPFVDLLPYLENEQPESLWVSLDDAHPNEKANRIIASAIERSLRAQLPELFQSEEPLATEDSQ